MACIVDTSEKYKPHEITINSNIILKHQVIRVKITCILTHKTHTPPC